MVLKMLQRVLILALLSWQGLALANGNPLHNQIQTLIIDVGESGCNFVRNGKQHSSTEGMEHITRKYEHFQDEIDSIYGFIELTSTKSLFTGKRYQVTCDGDSFDAAKWMQGRAARLGLL
jgi:hypothetical protein